MYIARQAIFDRSLNVFGYELLFRKSEQSVQFDGSSSEQATASVLGGLFEFGISQIVDNKRALVNFDDAFIHADILELISANSLIIEMLEDVNVDDKLIERLKFLKKKGYKIALDDFTNSYNTYPLVPLADIIKFDLIATPLDNISQDVKKAISQRKILLAEKIETQEEFLKAKEMGFHLFQGYFFSKPHIVGKSIDHTTTKSQYGRLRAELNKEEPSFQTLAEIIEMDASLAYRLVRISSKRAGDEMIYSIKKALNYMGLNELDRWITVLMLREFCDSKPDELMRISLLRTKFCELIAIHCNFMSAKYEASIMGLFSTLDAMLDEDMSEALKYIALPKSITDVLMYRKGVLLPIYTLMISYEQGDWIKVEKLVKQLNLDENVLNNDYINAVKWSTDNMKFM